MTLRHHVVTQALLRLLSTVLLVYYMVVLIGIIKSVLKIVPKVLILVLVWRLWNVHLHFDGLQFTLTNPGIPLRFYTPHWSLSAHQSPTFFFRSFFLSSTSSVFPHCEPMVWTKWIPKAWATRKANLLGIGLGLHNRFVFFTWMSRATRIESVIFIWMRHDTHNTWDCTTVLLQVSILFVRLCHSGRLAIQFLLDVWGGYD